MSDAPSQTGPSHAQAAVAGGRFRWSGLRKTFYLPRPSATVGWPPRLDFGQRVELVHGVATGQAYLEFRYQARGSESRTARHSADALARDLEFSLAAAFGSYLFTHEPQLISQPVRDWAHVYRFQPETYRLSLGRAVGLLRQADGAVTVRLAAEKGRRQSDFIRELIPIVRTGVDCLEVSIDLQPRFLSDLDLDAVVRALSALYSPDRLTSDKSPARPVNSLEQVAALASVLELWIERRQGLELHLCVRSVSAISRALLDSLASSALHGLSGSWSDSGTDPSVDPTSRVDTLDLSNCRPLGAPAPAIAPPPDFFQAAGFTERTIPMPGALADSGILLGIAGRGEREEAVRFSGKDRTRHCYVVGATGTGKSTLMMNMVIQDLQDSAGVCVLDPHGDLYRDLLSSVPAHRAQDIIPIDIADPDRAIGLNLLESGGRFARQQVSFAINELLSIFWTLYGAIPESMGPAFEQYMRNTLMALAQNSRGGATVADVIPFYEDSAFRTAVLSTCTNPATVSFFTRLANKTSGEVSFSNMGAYITNKLTRFVGSDFVRPVITQPVSTLNLLDCMDQGRVVLINLNKGIVGDIECRLIGMILLAKLFSAALQRAAEPRTARRVFHVYVDEAQNFVTPIVSSIVAEARKFGLTLTLANQNLAQWTAQSDRQLLEAILGNVGTLLTFRVGPDDAARLASFTAPEYGPRDLQYLADRTLVSKMLANGRPVPPFLVETLPPLLASDDNPVIAETLRANFEAHAVPRDEVEAEWQRRYAGTRAEGAAIAKGPPPERS